MDVSVPSKDGQRSRRSAARASVLGDGLLERTRSTSLALLGLTAAIGLAMVALALNQGWPLIAGAPIPGIGGSHQAVGDAVVVATAGPRGAQPTVLQAGSHAGSARLPGAPTRSGGKGAALAGARSPGAAHLVVSSPTPVSPVAQSPPSGTPEPAPVAPPPAPEPASTSATTTEPAVAAVPVSNPGPSSSGSGSQPAPESPVPPEEPVSDENAEQGHGHHYGRGTGRGHGHSRGGDDPGTEEPIESPEPAPAPTDETSPEAEADVPSESESGQSNTPLWGHGGSHSHGHGHW
jgi:hypothetical protein